MLQSELEKAEERRLRLAETISIAPTLLVWFRNQYPGARTDDLDAETAKAAYNLVLACERECGFES